MSWAADLRALRRPLRLARASLPALNPSAEQLSAEVGALSDAHLAMLRANLSRGIIPQWTHPALRQYCLAWLDAHEDGSVPSWLAPLARPPAWAEIPHA